MIPDFPHNIRIRLAWLNFFCCVLTLQSVCPVCCLSLAFLNWDSQQGSDLAKSGCNKKIQLGQSYSYIMRKVWYHQIWNQNYLGFIVLILNIDIIDGPHGKYRLINAKIDCAFEMKEVFFFELKELPFPLQGERTFRNHSHKVWKLPEAKQDGSKEDFSLWANISTPSVAKKIIVKNCRAYVPKLIFCLVVDK